MGKFKNPVLKRMGINIIRMVSKVLNDMNIRWALGHGTLLGQIRSNDLLNTCSDIDIDTFDVDRNTILSLKNELSRYFPFETLRNYRGVYYLLGFRISRIRLDIHFWYSKDDYMYRAEKYDEAKNQHVFYKLPEYIFEELVPIRFLGANAYIPGEPELYLNCIYGDEQWHKDDESGWYTKRDSPALIPEEECIVLGEI